MKTKIKRKRINTSRRRIGGKDRDILREIQNINLHLYKKCPNLHLKIDYRQNLEPNIAVFNDVSPNAEYAKNDMILCLYKTINLEEKCVSSITFEMNGKTIKISSKTDEDQESKKYNTFLRMCSIILAKIWKFEYLESDAQNAISVLLFINYFYDNIEFDPYFIDTLNNHILEDKKHSKNIQKMEEHSNKKNMEKFLVKNRKKFLTNKVNYPFIENYIYSNISTNIKLKLTDVVIDKCKKYIRGLLLYSDSKTKNSNFLKDINIVPIKDIELKC